MAIEYRAAIAKDDYEAFRMLVMTTLPGDYGMWLRVRARGKARAFEERGIIFDEVEITPDDFRAYCKNMKNPDFSIATLDRSAREKALRSLDQSGLADEHPPSTGHSPSVASTQATSTAL
jgi:hypothetical protein